jgi:hypothetical protein
MTSQPSYLFAQQRLSELVSRADRARLASEARLARSASAPRRDPAQSAAEPQVEEMYDRGVAPEEPRPASPQGGALAHAAGYPPLCVHGMNSRTDRGYDLALGRLRRG